MGTVPLASRETVITPPTPGSKVVLQLSQLDLLFNALVDDGYEVIGPTVSNRAITYQPITSTAGLPSGWTDQQQPGRYTLHPRDDGLVFGFTVGPHSWKRYLYPPTCRLYQIERHPRGFRLIPEDSHAPRLAFFGVRPCDLQAIAIQDQVLMHGQYSAPDYKARRDSSFLVAVNCTQPSGNCFCASMNSGPEARSGYDLSLTEVLQDDQHEFVVNVGSERGAEVLSRVPHEQATENHEKAAKALVAEAARHMGRTLDTAGIQDLFYRNPESPEWDNVAARCLSCANCTMVCPTCFCTTVEDTTDLSGAHAERWRRWDSCFTVDFSYIHGGSVRATPRSRYRQWMTHKLAAWIDQFGSSGCVGCGRCITWCPVGIDITAEVLALREYDSGASSPDSSRSSA